MAESAADRLDARAVDPEPPTPEQPSDCASVHPLANVLCEKPRGHEGYHERKIVSGRMQWSDPTDARAR